MIIFIYIFINFYLCYGEYEIKEKVIPSYLNMTFYDLPESIFPYDIKMSMSLSRVTGTLLYSIDSNDNQLIVNLNDVDQPSLNIEFSKQHFHVSLLDLCGCKRCRFENITLRIQMRDSIYLQCNEGKTKVLKYERTNMFNKNYPTPKFNKTDKLKAHLWLVNTPYFEDLYPNNDQLYGCIFDVWYKNKIIKMDSLAVGNKCRKTCIPGICNSGECLETYNKYPVCNCTASFNNGRFCNDIVKTENYRVIQKFQCKSIKLSFTSISNSFFNLNYKEITLMLSANDRNLNFFIDSTKEVHFRIKATITEKYQNQAENIVILIFQESYVDIKFYSNKVLLPFIRIPYLFDLSREVFDNLTLLSGKGIIAMVYKNDVRELEWHQLLYIEEKQNMTILQVVNQQVNTVPNCSRYNDENLFLKSKQSSQIKALNDKINIFFGCIMGEIIIIIGILLIMKLIQRKKNRETGLPKELILGSYSL